MPIDSQAFKPTEHGRIWRCGNCGFSFIAPRPSPAQTEEFYKIDDYYTHGKTHYADGTTLSSQGRLRAHLAWRVDRGEQDLARIARKALGPGKARICDLGCGDGTGVKLLMSAGFEVIAASFKDESLRVLAGSVEQIPTEIERGSCDGLLMDHVLEHIVDPVATMTEAGKLLRSGGIMLIVVPNNACLAAQRAGLAWTHLDVPRHVNFFSASTLRYAAERAGFIPERNFFNGYYRMFVDSLIATEQRIYDQLVAHLGAAPAATRRNSRMQSWRLLARTAAFCKPELKYDEVGIVVRKP